MRVLKLKKVGGEWPSYIVVGEDARRVARQVFQSEATVRTNAGGLGSA